MPSLCWFLKITVKKKLPAIFIKCSEYIFTKQIHDREFVGGEMRPILWKEGHSEKKLPTTLKKCLEYAITSCVKENVLVVIIYVQI